MPILAISPQDLQKVTEEALNLNSQIPFSEYLVKEGYASISPRLYLKENPLELIRIYDKKGQTHFQNFENKQDRGRLLDFIRNRSLEDGKIIPNKKIQSFLVAIEKLKVFLQKREPENLKLRVSQKERDILGNLNERFIHR